LVTHIVQSLTGLAVLFALTLVFAGPLMGQDGATGTVRGVVNDAEFGIPLFGVTVKILETDQSTETKTAGNFAIKAAPGTYTLIFSKDGFAKRVVPDVLVKAGQLKDVTVEMIPIFEELDEFVVQESLDLAAGSEASLLELRFDSPSLLDSIGADLINRSGASDAAGALRLVAGASLQDGKTAVIRGLPDRYVSSQLNGARLPSADADKRAIELDQFPSAVLESIQVSKTFTPDQQGDASGGAVNVKLKGIPDEPFFIRASAQYGYNTNVRNRSDFLSYRGGGFNFFGKDRGSRDPQFDLLGDEWAGAVGTSERDAPIDWKGTFAVGGRLELGGGVRVGGLFSFFYERDSSFFDDGRDDRLWRLNDGDPLTPSLAQVEDETDDFLTELFDVTQGTRQVQWGTLSTIGAEIDNHAVNITYFQTRTTEDTATLAQNTRGKAFFFPGFDPSDPNSPGYAQREASPYTRQQTLAYTERTTDTLQFTGTHKFEFEPFSVIEDGLKLTSIEVDWLYAISGARRYEPDKRQFGSLWTQELSFDFGGEPFVISPEGFTNLNPAAQVGIGNFQRIYTDVEEQSDQYAFNFQVNYEQWSGLEGFLKFGIYREDVERTFDQDTFANFEDITQFYASSFDNLYSDAFASGADRQFHPIDESFLDIDYFGEQEISAWYAMAKIPIFDNLSITGGVRFESTKISIVNEPDVRPNGSIAATFIDPISLAITSLDGENMGAADAEFEQDDVLPSIGVEYKPIDEVIIRAAYNETIARQVFKELSPIQQQEFLGADVFIGNPNLKAASVKNYDLRVDWTPYQGGLLSASYFRKELKDPIEFVQRRSNFDFTTAINYPEGTINGFEFEVRQDVGHFFEELEGLSIGGNATFIDAKVTLPEFDQQQFSGPGVNTPISERDQTNAPEHLFNFYATYDYEKWGTQIGLFYTITGDTLVAGAGLSGTRFIPNLYDQQFGTLNFSLAQRLGENFRISFKARNLTNPKIQRVYRSEFTEEALRSSRTRGVDFSLSISGEFRF
jgi:TonB-dependent receptor